MGKAIVIKDADFSAESVGTVHFTEIEREWALGIGDKIQTIVSDLINTSTTSLASTNRYFFGNSSSVLFAGKKVLKIVAGFIDSVTTHDIIIGTVNKNTTTLEAFNNSYTEIGTFTLTNRVPLDVTPFTVPEGKTLVFKFDGSTSVGLSLTAAATVSGVVYGVPGLDRNTGIKIASSDTMSLFIDFFVEY